MPGRVRLTIPSDERAVPILGAVAARFAEAIELQAVERDILDSIVELLARFLIANAYPDDPSGEIETTFEAEEGAVRVTLHDWGEPIPSFGGASPLPVPDALRDADVEADELQLINLGGEGKRLTAVFPARGVKAADPSAHAFGVRARTTPPRAEATADEIEIRPVREEEIEAVSRLLYSNYGLSYGHPDFYREDWFAEQLACGAVLSTVAVHGHQVVGHHALMHDGEEAAGETGVAVVHPAYRGLGIFGRLFAHTVERAEDQGLDAVYGRAVTVHPYSQRAERERGYRESALLLGAVPAKMAMEGIDGAHVGLRSATLVTYRPLGDPTPRAVTLPDRYANALLETYERLGLPLAPPQPVPRGDGPTVIVKDDQGRATGSLLVRRWDDGAVHDLREAVRQVMLHHEDVVHVDLDLHALTARQLDPIIEELRRRDFFLAGLMPFGPEGHDRLRLQRIQAANVELDGIVLDSDDAKALEAHVMADRATLDD
jgi:GNAT superfamily N-acetyltransferase